MAPGTAAERTFVVDRRLVVGRECVGVGPGERLIVDDPSVSRDHLELHIDRDGQATIVDRSTNGTTLNGTRLARGVPTAIRDGDRVSLGKTTLHYRAPDAQPAGEAALHQTIRQLQSGNLTLVPGNPLAVLTVREREILALIAQGQSNTAIAERLVLSPRTVEAHVRNIMTALRLPETTDDNRRVHAVLTYLRAVSTPRGAAAD